MARNIGRLYKPKNTTENMPTNTPDVAYTGELIRVQCLPLTLYLAALGIKTVDYFSLDIEGNEIDVLETIPFNEIDIKVMTFVLIYSESHLQTCPFARLMRDVRCSIYFTCSRGNGTVFAAQ